MRPTHVQDGIAHSRWKSTEWSGGGAAYVRAKAGASLVLTSAAPFAHRPDRATQRSRNLWVRLSGGGPFGDVQPLWEGGHLSVPYYRASNRTASSSNDQRIELENQGRYQLRPLGTIL